MLESLLTSRIARLDFCQSIVPLCSLVPGLLLLLDLVLQNTLLDQRWCGLHLEIDSPPLNFSFFETVPDMTRVISIDRRRDEEQH